MSERKEENFYTMAEKIREELNKCDFMSHIETESVLEILRDMPASDKNDLTRILNECVGEERRFCVTPLDMRHHTFFFHQKQRRFISTEGAIPDVSPFDENSMVGSFEEKLNNWKICVKNLRHLQRGYWCVKQEAELQYQGHVVAFMHNDSSFFMNGVVISPVIGFAEFIAEKINKRLHNASIYPCRLEDFACVAATAVSEKQMRLYGESPETIKELTKRFCELKRVDSEFSMAR